MPVTIDLAAPTWPVPLSMLVRLRRLTDISDGGELQEYVRDVVLAASKRILGITASAATRTFEVDQYAASNLILDLATITAWYVPDTAFPGNRADEFLRRYLTVVVQSLGLDEADVPVPTQGVIGRFLRVIMLGSTADDPGVSDLEVYQYLKAAGSTPARLFGIVSGIAAGLYGDPDALDLANLETESNLTVTMGGVLFNGQTGADLGSQMLTITEADGIQIGGSLLIDPIYFPL